MRVILIVASDSVARRRIADALMRAGYGVCETHTSDLVPAVPRLDAVVSDASIRAGRFGAPIVPIAQPLDLEGVLAHVHRVVAEEKAA